MNNVKFFVVVALILAALVALSEIFTVFFYRKTDSSVASISISTVPGTYDMEFLDVYIDRAKRYLLMTSEQFESQVDPANLEGIEPTGVLDE